MIGMSHRLIPGHRQQVYIPFEHFEVERNSLRRSAVPSKE